MHNSHSRQIKYKYFFKKMWGREKGVLLTENRLDRRGKGTQGGGSLRLPSRGPRVWGVAAQGPIRACSQGTRGLRDASLYSTRLLDKAQGEQDAGLQEPRAPGQRQPELWARVRCPGGPEGHPPA